MTDQAIIRGFCRNKEQRDALLTHGLTPRAIFMEGAGAESLDACLATFRGRPGVLIIAHDARIFGGTKRLVAETMAKLETAGVRVVDITHPDDKTVSQQIQRAHVAISGSRIRGDRPRARRQGRAGGYAKGRAAVAWRSSLAPDWLIDNIVDHPDLTWKTRMDILGAHFTKSTLRRRYGSAAKRS